MNANACLTAVEIDRALHDPEDSTALRHVRECARCAAIARSLAAFERGVEPAPLADPAAATALDAYVARLTGSAPKQGAKVLPFPRSGAPMMRLVAAAAAVLAIAAIAYLAPRPLDRAERLRGEVADPASVRLRPAVARGETWSLEWSELANAASYEVLVVGPDLGEIARFPAGLDRSFELRRESLPATLPAPIYWQVEARSTTGAFVRSTLQALPAR